MKEPSLVATLRDLFPFGKDYDELPKKENAKVEGSTPGITKQKDSDKDESEAEARKLSVSSKNKKKEEGKSYLTEYFDKDLTSKEAYEAYKQHEVAIHAKSNFLYTINNYIRMTSRLTGGLALGAILAQYPLIQQLLGVVFSEGVITAITGMGPVFVIALAVTGITLGIASFAIDQYVNRMNTEKRVDNNDFSMRRGTQISAQLGAEVSAPITARIQAPILAKAIVDELNKNAARSDGQTWAQAVSKNSMDQANWKETVQQESPAEQPPAPARQ